MPIILTPVSTDGWAITLDDRTGSPVTLNSTASRIVGAMSGAIGIANPRTSRRPRPTNHGGLDDTRWTDGALIEIQGEVSSDTFEGALAEFRTITQPMIETLDYGAALLKWTEGVSGNSLQRAVKLASDVDANVAGLTGPIIPYQAQFFAEDPRAYSQTLQTVDSTFLSTAAGGLTLPMKFPIKFNASSGGTATVTNGGNRTTPPTFRIFGGCTNPTIKNVTTGDQIAIVGTIATGDYLEVGTDSSGQRYAKLNGTSLQNNLIDSANTTWYELQAGVTSLQMVSGTFDGSAFLRTLFRNAYA